MSILRIRDENGKVQEIPVIKGDPYTLTEADKAEIANLVLENFTDVSEVAL